MLPNTAARRDLRALSSMSAFYRRDPPATKVELCSSVIVILRSLPDGGSHPGCLEGAIELLPKQPENRPFKSDMRTILLLCRCCQIIPASQPRSRAVYARSSPSRAPMPSCWMSAWRRRRDMRNPAPARRAEKMAKMRNAVYSPVRSIITPNEKTGMAFER